MPGDGCFFCDPVQLEAARRRTEEKTMENDVKEDMASPPNGVAPGDASKGGK